LATITHWAAVPGHAPLHPTNVCPAAGVALSVTVVPSANAWVQLFGPIQSSPLGLEVTVPEPPIETTTAAVCAAVVDVGFDVPPAVFEESPPPHAARKVATAHAAPKRKTDINFTTHQQSNGHRGNAHSGEWTPPEWTPPKWREIT
jgi:hypothetical protein